ARQQVVDATRKDCPVVDQNAEYDGADKHKRNDYGRTQQTPQYATRETGFSLDVGNNPGIAARRYRVWRRITYWHKRFSGENPCELSSSRASTYYATLREQFLR